MFFPFSSGAIDASVVTNASAIEWHKVVPFSPFNTESNTSSYLQWAIRMPQFGVCTNFFIDNDLNSDAFW